MRPTDAKSTDAEPPKVVGYTVLFKPNVKRSRWRTIATTDTYAEAVAAMKGHGSFRIVEVTEPKGATLFG